MTQPDEEPAQGSNRYAYEAVSQPSSAPTSPIRTRRPSYTMSRMSGSQQPEEADERSSLLGLQQNPRRRYTRSMMGSRQLSQANSFVGSLKAHKSKSKRRSESTSPQWFRNSGLKTPKLYQSLAGSMFTDDRVWYDQFTSTDWVHDSIADGYRVLELRKSKGIRGRLRLFFDAAQGWILVAVIGLLTALAAYVVDISEHTLYDLKEGYCQDRWYASRSSCCSSKPDCNDWRTWSEIIHSPKVDNWIIDYTAFILGCVIFAVLACFLTLCSKTVVPSHIASTFDENLGAVKSMNLEDDKEEDNATMKDVLPANIYYSAAGSGVAEVKVILSGFVLHGYLGARTLILKMVGLILAVSSGMSLGKEGPYVHIAACIGNIACRIFPKYNLNDGKRREILSSSAGSGVAVAFGSPLGGVLFSLEEVSYYFPPKTLFRTFFCCIAAALSLKFLNPYGTSKIVLFEVRFVTDWHYFELINFALLGVAGGLLGALFIKASRLWATSFRRVTVIKSHPMLEVVLVALITGVISYWNRYTKLPVAELLFELASPCTAKTNTGLCPVENDIPKVMRYLTVAFIIKSFLTVITFGIKVPAGIYVPSMVVGGLMGRIVGHIAQYVTLRYPDMWLIGNCSKAAQMGDTEACITPGVYALVAAGATMCGVTRLSVTLAVILFELTGSLDHVLPFSLGVLCAKWTADAVEPLSIYDLLTDMNSYPFLDNKITPVFDTELGDITPRLRRDRLIDITISPLVKSSVLRSKLTKLQDAGELDGGLPIIRDKVLVGLIPAPDLEFALDRVEEEHHEDILCLMSKPEHAAHAHRFSEDTSENSETEHAFGIEAADDTITADFTAYVDPAPVALDMHSPMDLVFQCFMKLGLRYICVIEDGLYRGMVHKKAFVRYVKSSEGDLSKS